MNRQSPLAFWVIAIAAGMLCPAARAIEPAEAFLDGLRERGYFDVAIDYLDSIPKNPAVPVAFKQTLMYERGLTLISGAKFQRDSALREKQLDEAQKTLSEFVSAQANSPLAIAARSQLGNVIVERARNRVEKAKKVSAAEKQTLTKEARALYNEAIKVFEALITEVGERLKAYPAAMDEKKDAKRVEERDRFRTEYLQAQLLVAATYEEIAETMDKGTKERTDALTKAEVAYKEVYEKYRTRLAGLYARMYEGRCLQKLGKHMEATAIFVELLSNKDENEVFRALNFKVMCLAVASWAAQNLHLEVVNRAQPMVNTARPAEDKTGEMMGLRLDVARSIKAYTTDLAKANPRDTKIKPLMTDARKMVTYVTKYPGEHQDAARKLLPEFTGGDADAPTDRPEPKTFAEARSAAKEAIDAMQTSNLLIKTLPARLQSEKDAAQRAEIQKQLTEAQEIAKKSGVEALHYCKLALKFVDKDTELADVNLIRYLICYLLYSENNYYDASVIGEFIAHRFPDSQGARQCAKIAMASYLKLYGENQTEDKEYESQKIIDICDYITKKWPNEPEAEEALNTLIPFMIKEKKLEQAQDYLQKIPAESPHRSGAELKTGQALWASYLENSKQIRDWENGVTQMPEGTDLAPRKAELVVLKDKAKKTLEDGIAGMKARNESSQIMATAVLSLAQIYVDTNEAAKAATLMEDPKVGVLTLVRAKDPTTEKKGFPEETFKTALRAYISSLAGSKDATATVAKAKKVMEELKEFMAATPDGQQQLVAIYVSLARDLQRQMEIADPAVKSSLGQGFEAFLSQVAKDATELNVLNWVAETYRGMGESFLSAKQTLPPPEATKYFKSAVETYNKILDKGKATAGFLTPAMTTQLRLQLAKTLKSNGDYTGAMDMFEAILKAQPTMLPVQIEAARTYQDWAHLSKTPADKERYYKSAYLGARPDKTNPDVNKRLKNIIWGWGEIGKMTASNPQFRDQFHESRYNLALCRYNMALSQADPKKTDTLKSAQRDISITVGLYSDMGGEKWKGQYDTLLKSIQKALGERPLGLSALEVKPPASTPPVSGTAPPAGGTTPPPATAPAATTPPAATKAVAPAPATKTTTTAVK